MILQTGRPGGYNVDSYCCMLLTLCLYISFLLLKLPSFAKFIESKITGREWVEGYWQGEVFYPETQTMCNSNCEGNMRFHEIQRKNYRLFDARSTMNCLVAEKYNHIVVVGDSYMRNLFHGIIDIISDTRREIKGKEQEILESLQPVRYLDKYSLQLEVLNIRLTYLHQFGLWSRLSISLPELDRKGTLVLYGSMVHDHKFRQVDFLISKHEKQKKLAKRLLRDKEGSGRDGYREMAHNIWMKRLSALQIFERATLIWVTSPYYETHKLEQVNQFARINQDNERYFRFNLDGVNKLLLDPRVRFLDVYHLTKACKYENCSLDGAHRSAFVNRMKFQIVLNYICK